MNKPATSLFTLLAACAVLSGSACQTAEEADDSSPGTEVNKGAASDLCSGPDACGAVCSQASCDLECWAFLTDEEGSPGHCASVTCGAVHSNCNPGGGGGGGTSCGSSCRPVAGNGKLLGQSAHLVVVSHKGQPLRYAPQIFNTYARAQFGGDPGCSGVRCRCDEVRTVQSSTWVGPSPLPPSSPDRWGSSKVRTWGQTGPGACKHY